MSHTPMIPLQGKLELFAERLEADVGEFCFGHIQDIINDLKRVKQERAFNVVSDEWINTHLARQEYLVFEGTQGALLDEWNGFHPHTTWATTTSENALTVIDEAGIDVKPRILGVTRTYHTRHGYGPFPSENMDYLTKYPEKHNKTGRWQGDWRAGPLDITLLDYAVRVNKGIDEVVISHCDREITEYARTPINLPVVGMLQDIEEQEIELTQPLTELYGKSERIPVSDTDEVLDIIQETVKAPIAIKAYGERINQREGE